MTLNSHTFFFTALRFHFIVSEENKALKKCILAIMAPNLQAMYVLSFLKSTISIYATHSSSLSFLERILSRKQAQQCMRKRFELVFTAFSDCCSTKNFPFPSLIFPYFLFPFTVILLIPLTQSTYYGFFWEKEKRVRSTNTFLLIRHVSYH